MEPLAALLDAIGIFINGMMATYLYHHLILKQEFSSIDSGNYAALSLLAAVLFVTLYKAMGCYKQFLSSLTSPQLRQAIYIWVFVVALLSLTTFLLKNSNFFSRGTILFFALTGIITIGLNRVFWRQIVKILTEKNMIFLVKVLLIRCSAESAEKNRSMAAPTIARDFGGGYSLTHQIELNLDNPSGLANLDPIVRRLIVERAVDEIFVEVQHNDLDDIPRIMNSLRMFPLPVRIILDPITTALFSRPVKNVGSLLLAEVQRHPLTIVDRAVKRILDVTVALFALIVFAPLFLMVAVIIKMESPGPVFFVQDRKGFSGRVFKILKFRSMKVTENGVEIKQATHDDQRVTKVGRFIRRTSIDELPQLLNVLKGNMSIVGPRPHAVAHDNYYGDLIAEYALRHHTKPGLTGLSQVMGLRGETPRVEDMKERVESDVSYINNWSFWGDVSIIMKTSLVLFGNRKAY